MLPSIVKSGHKGSSQEVVVEQLKCNGGGALTASWLA